MRLQAEHVLTHYRPSSASVEELFKIKSHFGTVFELNKHTTQKTIITINLHIYKTSTHDGMNPSVIYRSCNAN